MRVRSYTSRWTRVGRRPIAVVAGLAVVALLAVVAPGSATAGASAPTHRTTVLPWPSSDTWEDSTAPVQGCDPLVDQPSTATSCLLPFPDDFLTVHDPSTSTGRAR